MPFRGLANDKIVEDLKNHNFLELAELQAKFNFPIAEHLLKVNLISQGCH